MNEKSACVFFLTVESSIDPTTKYLLTCIYKEVYEVPPPRGCFFYPSKGQSGEAEKIFEITSGSDHLTIRQWFYIANICNGYAFVESLRNGIKVPVHGSPYYVHAPSNVVPEMLEEQQSEIDKIVSKYSSYVSKKYIYGEYQFLERVNFPVFRDSIVANLKRQPGDNDLLLDIFPLGFIGAAELQDLLRRRIIFQIQSSLFSATFHGDRKQIEKATNKPIRFIGFIKDCPIPKEYIGICISEDNPIGIALSVSMVNPKTGTWEYVSQKPIANGFITVTDIRDHKLIAQEQFQLITGFNTKITIINNSVKDIYGNIIHYSHESIADSPRPIEPIGREFFRESYQGITDSEYEGVVADYLSALFCHIGPDLMICDPYLIDNLDCTSGVVRLNGGQRVFFQALIKALTSNKMDTLYLLANKERISHFWKNFDEIPEGYVMIFNQLKNVQPIKVKIKITSTAFHNRRIIKINKSDDILYSSSAYELSTSLGGIITAGDFQVTVHDASMAEKVGHRVLKLWKEAAFGEFII